MSADLPDGLEAMRQVLSLSDIMKLIESTAKWVSPETFRLLPVWYPELSRKAYFYKENWSEPLLNKNRQDGTEIHKREGNTRANEALTRALGLTKSKRPNWSCCHIWGGDDLTYQQHNAVVQDPRYYSCVANMVLLPSPLKAFTDALIEVKTMLRVCSKHLYGWVCEHNSVKDSLAFVEDFDDWAAYPNSWPRQTGSSRPNGVVPLNQTIQQAISRRKTRIKSDLINAGPHYPTDSVKRTLRYWDIVL